MLVGTCFKVLQQFCLVLLVVFLFPSCGMSVDPEEDTGVFKSV